MGALGFPLSEAGSYEDLAQRSLPEKVCSVKEAVEMRRFLILCVLLVLAVPPALAQKGIISIGDYTAKPGDIISVDIMMDEKVKNVAGIQLTVEFRESTVAGAPPLVALENPQKPGSGEADLTRGPKLPVGAFVMSDARMAGKLRLAVVYIEGFSGPGQLVSFRLSIPANAPHGAKYILKLKDVVANDSYVSPIELNVKDGSVTVVPPVRGDVNGDGKVTISDATIALRIAVGINRASDYQLRVGDLNGNGKIDVSDTVRILCAAVGIEVL